MGLDISLVEDQNERELGLVQNTVSLALRRSISDAKAIRLLPASIQHIGHESRRSLSSRGVNDVGHNGRKGGSHGIGDDGP